MDTLAFNVASSRDLSRFPGFFDLGLGQMKMKWDFRDFRNSVGFFCSLAYFECWACLEGCSYFFCFMDSHLLFNKTYFFLNNFSVILSPWIFFFLKYLFLIFFLDFFFLNFFFLNIFGLKSLKFVFLPFFAWIRHQKGLITYLSKVFTQLMSAWDFLPRRGIFFGIFESDLLATLLALANIHSTVVKETKPMPMS